MPPPPPPSSSSSIASSSSLRRDLAAPPFSNPQTLTLRPAPSASAASKNAHQRSSAFRTNPKTGRSASSKTSTLRSAETSNPNALIGFGFHDVVIETPFHGVRLSDLSQADLGDVVLACRDRVCQMERSGSLEYVQVFKNYGASAGASMTHSHSQIIGLPLVPPTVSARFNSLKEVFDKSGKCGLCEAGSDDILIDESDHFLAIVPFAASFPFEVWIIPREHTSYFHDLDEQKAMDFGGLLKLILLKLSKQLNDPPYNFMIHSSPFHLPASYLPYAHWFIQIVPQLNVIGGFEIGSGCYINPVFPEDAAKVLREVNCTIN